MKRDRYGRFAPKNGGAIKPFKSNLLAGRRGGAPRVKTHQLPLRQIKNQGKGYTKLPNRREVRQALVKSAGTGAFLGLTVGGPTGAVVGAAGTTALTGLTIARRSRG